jgi:hypothetical protein
VKPAIYNEASTSVPKELKPQGKRGQTYFIAKALRGYYSDFIADTLVGLEVKGELGVVTPVRECG